MTTSDQQIGANVTRLRGSFPQTAIAKLMRSLGWRWSQTTVWTVEKGERPLRLAEAQDLAVALSALSGDEVTPMDFLALEGSPELRVMLRRIGREWVALRDSLELFEGSQSLLRALAHAHADEMTDEQRVLVNSWLEDDVLTRPRQQVTVDLAEQDDGEHSET